MEKEIAKKLLEIKAVFLSPNKPFTWASGIKSPIYCDNRLTLSYPSVRHIVEMGLANTIRNNFNDVEMLMGTATAGIAHAALVSEILDLPMGYVRGSAKGHGRTNQIEGKITKGMKVVVVEDLISTGGSVLDVVDVLTEAGVEVLGVVAIFSYGLEVAIDIFAKRDVKLCTLSNYDSLIEVALKEGYVDEKDIDALKKWKINPKDESWMNK